MKRVFCIDWCDLLENCHELQTAFFYTEHEFRAGFNDFSLVSHKRFLEALKNSIAMADAEEQPLLHQQYKQVEKHLEHIMATAGEVVYVNIEGGPGTSNGNIPLPKKPQD